MFIGAAYHMRTLRSITERELVLSRPLPLVAWFNLSFQVTKTELDLSWSMELSLDHHKPFCEVAVDILREEIDAIFEEE